ncbi:MAG: hypothetical protein DRH44_06950 [Candidatus Coatesbacteria bacterium]|nr:MAG: hypothetical protein DRH44_06950 [Candidatus Coatesbacteria bacterium]
MSRQIFFLILLVLVLHIITVFTILKPHINPYIGDMMDKHMVYMVSKSIIEGDIQPSPYWNIGYPALLALTHKFGVPYITAERWLSLPFSLLMLLLTFLVVMRLSDVKVAFFTCLAMSVSQVFILKSIGAKDFMLSGALILASIVVFYNFSDENRNWRIILYGLILGVAFTFRYISIYLLPVFIVYIFIIKGRRAGLYQSLYYTAGFIVGALPQFAIATHEWGNPLYSENAKTIWFTINHINDWARFLTTGGRFNIIGVFADNPLGFIVNWVKSINAFVTSFHLNPPLIYLSYAGLIVFLIKVKNNWFRFIIVALSIYLAITFVYRAYSDYLLPVLPFLAFGGVWFIFRFIPERLERRRLGWFPIRFIIVVMVILYMFAYSYNRINRTDEAVVWERKAIRGVAEVLRDDGVDDPSVVLSTDLWYLYLPDARADLWEYDQVPFDMSEPDEVLEYAVKGGYRYLLLYDRYRGADGDWGGLPERLMEMDLPYEFELLLEMEDTKRRLELYRIME